MLLNGRPARGLQEQTIGQRALLTALSGARKRRRMRRRPAHDSFRGYICRSSVATRSARS